MSYKPPDRAQSALALHAMISLDDGDYAITGASSTGAITLPDSSVISIGEDTTIQLASFNQVQGTSATFVLDNGATRFSIHHPQGATANYRFETPTGTIAVRGTEGDIAVEHDRMQVNVYELTDPALPVTVTLKSGKKYAVTPGKTLATHVERGRPVVEVHDLSRTAMTRFNRQFGQPRGVTPEGKPRHFETKPPQHPKPPEHEHLHPRPSPHPKPSPHDKSEPHSKSTPHPKTTPHPKSSPHAKGTLHPKATPRPKASPHAKETPHPTSTAHPRAKPTPHAKAKVVPHPRYTPHPRHTPHSKPTERPQRREYGPGTRPPHLGRER
ncbi:MAG: FecR domain-containing protein [Vulcanimicrobiaceae bacterium]